MTQDEVRSRIAKDTGNNAVVRVVRCEHRGFCAAAFDADPGDVTAKDFDINPRIMAAGPWCTTEEEALDALALEWMEGLE